MSNKATSTWNTKLPLVEAIFLWWISSGEFPDEAPNRRKPERGNPRRPTLVHEKMSDFPNTENDGRHSPTTRAGRALKRAAKRTGEIFLGFCEVVGFVVDVVVNVSRVIWGLVRAIGKLFDF